MMPFSKRLVKIERLGHVGISVPDVLGGAAHFEKNLGFTALDYVGKFAALMRVHGSPLHHSVGWPSRRSAISSTSTAWCRISTTSVVRSGG